MTCSSDWTPGRFPSRCCHHSWPCAHPRGPRSLSWSCSRTRLRRTDPSSRPSFHGVCRPFDALSTQNPLPDAFVRSGRSRHFRTRLVAGFHTRFGPPTPFLATLTVYASAYPAASFSRSRPWGWAPGSLYQVLSHRSEDRSFRTQGVGVCTREAPGRCARLRDLRRTPWCSAAPVASDRSSSGSPLRSSPLASAACPSSARRRSSDFRLAASPRGLPRPTIPARTAMRWHRPRLVGFPLPCTYDPRPRVTAAQGRPTGNEPTCFLVGPPCAPGPACSRPLDRSRLPTSPDRFPDSAHRLRRRFVGCSAGPSATRTHY